MPRLVCCLVLVSLPAAAWAAESKPPALAATVREPSPADAAAPVEFNRDVRPILSEYCFACHGPDKNKREAELRLDTREGLFARREERTIVAPGKPAASELLRRVSSHDDRDRMPPPEFVRQPEPHHVATLRAWIAAGAPWQGHWAYLPPARPTPPTVDEPGFVVNDIDRFILARLNREKLSHAPPADPATLLRRLSFDLQGLPPASDVLQPRPPVTGSIEHHETEDRDQQSRLYGETVDRLLDSPHFGERMATYWLDLVRFADTIGYHSDNPRDITPYRDYVISAFNDNKPFDQFTIEQLAGDLLPDATLWQRVASGYNRLNQTTEEGGAQAKEYLAKYAADRVRNVSSVWLGSTMGCCECHDHKFDPFTMRDFYSFAAFFADVKETAVGRREAGIVVPDAGQQAELEKLSLGIENTKRSLTATTPELTAAQQAWEKSLAGRAFVAWHPLRPEQATAARRGAELKIQPDGSVVATGPDLDKETYTIVAKTRLRDITAVRIEAEGRDVQGNFTLTALALNRQLRTAEKPDPVPFETVKAWSVSQPQSVTAARVFPVQLSFGDGDETTLTFVLKQEAEPRRNIGRVRIAVTDSPLPLVGDAEAHPSAAVVRVLGVEPARRTPAQARELADYYRSIAPQLGPLRLELAALEASREALLGRMRRSLVSEAAAPREMRMLPRGNWQDDSGAAVEPAVPGFLPSLRVSGRRATRLDLAQWLVARENPLVARVFVNRLWKLFFGAGLSRSLEDLGAQGQWPVHPELLDWLACEFIDSGWDVKHLVRLMVTSGTYRQASRASAAARERDPDNRLLARQSRWRLDAEFVRDNALAVSGLLVHTVGGESIKPYQPDGYWEFLNFPKRTYAHDRGPGQYRRGLYAHWQRSFLHPSLLAFDATSREECTAERPRSNTPQQALVLLNDPTYVEAARVFAQQVLASGAASDQSRLHWAFRRTLTRDPRPDELDVLLRLLTKHLAHYGGHGESAEQLASAGESPKPEALDAPTLAAWTSVCRALLNLHETITRY